MHRRQFHQLTAASWPLFIGMRHTSTSTTKKPKDLPPLKQGDTVGLIAPASPPHEGQLGRAIEQLKSLGLRPTIGIHAKKRDGYLAGSDDERLADIRMMMEDEKVKAIWCIRGGYGLTRILPKIKQRWFSHPKLVIGYSDITAWQLQLADWGIPSLHAQIAGAEWTPSVRSQLERLLFGSGDKELLEVSADGYTIRGGQAEGQLIGGNLSLMTAMVGTSCMPRLRGRIVFIEEVGEKPYRIDRMLTQLIQGSDFSKAKGVVLGQFSDCETSAPSTSWTLRQVLDDRLGQLGIPCAYGLPFGHVEDNRAMPQLRLAAFDADKITLSY